MTILAIGHHRLEERRPTQQAAAVYPGVSGAGLGDTPDHGHVPRVDMLFHVVNDLLHGCQAPDEWQPGANHQIELIARPSASSPITHCLRAPPPPSCKPGSA